jgi:hypothetical protein
MNHLRNTIAQVRTKLISNNTIKRYIQSDSVHVTVLAFSSVGFVAGGFVGLVNGFHTALEDAVYSRHSYLTTRQSIGQSIYMVANIIGQPIVGAIAGTAIGATAPISIPVLYYLYQDAESKIEDKCEL